MRAPVYAIAAAILLALSPLSAGLPPPPPPTVGPILAITSPGDAVAASLTAAGYAPCAPVLAAGDCFDTVDASLFGAANIADRRVLFVGTHDNASAVHAALVARAGDIKAWVAAGGSLLSLSERQPTNGSFSAGGYEYIPNDAAWPFYTSPTVGDSVLVTPYGSTHPAIPSSTSASLSGWAPSFESIIGERPNYMFPIANGDGIVTYTDPDGTTYSHSMRGAVALAGNFGDGCVLLTTLRADVVAADPGHTRATDAQAFLRDVLEWGLHCSAVPLFPMPYAGAIVIRRVQGGPVTAQTSAGLSCSSPTFTGSAYEVSCVPSVPPAPGTEWTCLGQTVAAVYVGLFSLTGTSMCDSNVAAKCTANSTGAPCWATSALAQGPLPFRCVAQPSAATTVPQPTWSVLCGSVDP